MNLIGDVKGKVAVMLDDMIDTAGKLFCKTIYIAIYMVLFMAGSSIHDNFQLLPL